MRCYILSDQQSAAIMSVLNWLTWGTTLHATVDTSTRVTYQLVTIHKIAAVRSSGSNSHSMTRLQCERPGEMWFEWYYFLDEPKFCSFGFRYHTWSSSVTNKWLSMQNSSTTTPLNEISATNISLLMKLFADLHYEPLCKRKLLRPRWRLGEGPFHPSLGCVKKTCNSG